MILHQDEPLSNEEWALAQILKNPVLFREFINDHNPVRKPLEPHERAWSTSETPYLSMCCGRGVRKTETLIELLYYWMVNEDFIPGDPGLLVYVPNKAQKDAIFPRIKEACEKHWFMKHLVNLNRINVAEGRIEFHNGFVFILRIAGSEGRESNVISIHTNRIWIDEAQDFPWRAWLSVQNVLRFDIPHHMLWVSGVPNGERRENVLYYCDQEDEKYISWNISKEMMSWWNMELEIEERRRYGAVVEDSEEYKHYVLGQHGVPTFSVFDRQRFLREDYEVQKIVVTQQMLDAFRRIDPDGVERYYINEAILCPPVPSVYGLKPKVVLGWDVGYSPDPSVFFLMARDLSTGVWRNFLRVVLQRVQYPLQRETLLWLDKVYGFDAIGIDMGGPGKVVYQELTTDLAEQEYLDRNYRGRIFPVEFGGRITVALQDENNDIIEKKDNVKRVAVETVSRWVGEHRFAFAQEDSNLMDELEGTKLTRTNTGEPLYKTPLVDHQFAAMMCAVMAWEHFYGEPLGKPRLEARPKLVTAQWLKGVA